MPETKDFYRILQVHNEASREVIEAAYRRLCRMFHPDVNPAPDATVRMQEINRAYEVLSDASKREEYNRTRRGAGSVAGKAAPKEAERSHGPAYEAMDVFFRSLLENAFDQAYNLLTVSDRKKVSLEDFRVWKRSVAGIYKMGAYAIKPFRRYRRCSVFGHVYEEISEFSVFVTDMNVRTGRVSEDYCIKYAVKDQGRWRVCLGYDDVRPLITKFRYLAENAVPADADKLYAEAVLRRDARTGMLSRMGFLEQAEKEVFRSKRYGNRFSIGMFCIIPPRSRGEFVDDDYKAMCIMHSARAIGSHIRQTDIAGRISSTEFAVLFAETQLREAALAAGKLINIMRSDSAVEYEVAYGVSEFRGTELDETVLEALSAARFRRVLIDGVETSCIFANEST